MTAFSDRLAHVYSSWLACCFAYLDDEQPPRSGFRLGGDGASVLSRAGFEKEIEVLRDQPGFTPPPSLEPSSLERGWTPRKSLGSLSRRGFSVRKRHPSTRRPQISAPSDFRHVYSESFQFPSQAPPFAQVQQWPPSFQPLELNIYMTDRPLSPILPAFEYAHPDVTPPPHALTHGSSFDSDGITLAHQRSYSSMSFHLPRRLAAESSPLTSFDGSPPRIPSRSRLRANTAQSSATTMQSVDHIVERIASAMLERDRLQAEIDSVLERQSIYISSRPSTAYGLEGERGDAQWPLEYGAERTDLEPMPSVPALPAAAPSFAERLSTERPLTAASQTAEASGRGAEAPPRSFPTPPPRQITPPRSSPRINGRPVDLPLAPPLPLVLRPPLRKKKSFSRVSNWLFPSEDGSHGRDISLDSVTNLPRPVTGREGFYQCMTPAEAPGRRSSLDSVTTVSTWTTTEEDRTMPTTWSPGSSPVTKHETPTPTAAPERRGAFGGKAAVGGNGNRHRPQSVGVAF